MNKRIKEGTWAWQPRRANTAIKEIEAWKKKWYNIIGDDLLFDAMDNAIERIRQMKKDDERSKTVDRKPILGELFSKTLEESKRLI